MDNDIAYMNCLELGAHFRSGELSPVHVTGLMLERITALNAKLNMLYAIDADAALAAAQASERRWLTDTARGPLDGIPTTIKDALDCAGMPTFRGSAAQPPGGVVPAVDAPAVARLREQGCVFLGKSTMPDFGILASGYSSHHGVTRNPWNPARNTGGSSAGAAASIAAGISPLAIGTDIVGSIRLPASFCGIFGHKPSQGRVPYYFPGAPTLVAGPLTRTVRDAALMLDIISQPDRRDFTALPPPNVSFLTELERSPSPARLGLMRAIGFGPVPDPEVAVLVESAARAFAAEGHEIIPIEPPFAAGDDASAEFFYKARCYSEFSKFPAAVRARAAIINSWTANMARRGANELFDAMNVLQLQRQRIVQLFDDIDYLLLPSVAIPPYAGTEPAPERDALFAPWSNNFLFNLSEQPAASINCGYTDDGLPVGLQIVGKRFDDAGVLRVARFYEAIRPPQSPWPLAGDLSALAANLSIDEGGSHVDRNNAG